MKTSITIALMILIAMGTRGQNQSDQVAVLKKCIDMPDVKMHSSRTGNQDYDHVCIWQHKFVFPEDVVQSESGKHISFLNDAQLNAYRPDTYLSFRKFDIAKDIATVLFDCHYRQSSADAKGLKTISVKFQKVASDWEVVESNTERR